MEPNETLNKMEEEMSTPNFPIGKKDMLTGMAIYCIGAAAGYLVGKFVIVPFVKNLISRREVRKSIKESCYDVESDEFETEADN